ncbi:MAG: class I SAM-dependent methyltransferase [Promethearchaeota archaeon]
MDLKQILVNQVRKPNGKLGGLIARGMNRGHSKLAKWGLSNFSIEPNYAILDIGCGGGGNIKHFAKTITDGKIFGIDYSETAVDISMKVNKKFIEKGTVEINQGSVSSLPFEDNYFDLVTGFETSYFWPDLIRDLQEIYRVLKPNGHLILTNEGYICNNEKKRKIAENWSKLGDFPIHTPNEYREFLKDAGYSNIQIFENYDKGWITAICMKKY